MQNTALLNASVPTRSLDEWCLVADFPARHPALLTSARLAYWMRSRDENGLAECIIKIGRSHYIHEPSFMLWLDTRRGADGF